MSTQRISDQKLFKITGKHFGIKGFDPLVYVFRGYVGKWEVKNMSDFRTASPEQLAFMEDVLNGVAK